MRGICCLFNIILLIFSSKYPFQSPRKHVFLDALPQILFCCQFKKGDIVKSCWRISKLKSVQIPPKNRYFYPTSDHSTHHRGYRLSLPINDNCPFDNETEKKRKVRIIPLSCVLACVYMLRRETVSERVCDARRPQTPNTLAINSPRTQMTIDNTNDNVITNDNEWAMCYNTKEPGSVNKPVKLWKKELCRNNTSRCLIGTKIDLDHLWQ